MTERDLESLRDLRAPAPRPDARRRAIDAAMQEFNTAKNENPSIAADNEIATTTTEEVAIETQGNVHVLRPTESSVGPRRTSMLSKTSMRIAASVAVLAIGVPAAVMVYREHHGGRVMGLVGNEGRTAALQKPTVPVMKAPVAALSSTDKKTVEATQITSGPPAQQDRSADAPRRIATIVVNRDGSVAPANGGQTNNAATAPMVAVPGFIVEAPKAMPPVPPQTNELKNERSVRIAPSAQFGAGHQTYSNQRGNSPSDAAEVQRQASAAKKKAESVDSSRFRLTGDARIATEAERDGMRRDIDALRKELAEVQGRRNHPLLGNSVELKRRAELKQLEQRYNGGLVLQPADHDKVIHPPVEQSRDQFDPTPPSPVKQVTQEPVSTFSIDVDTASYAFARRAINTGRLPPREAVRVEEMINYFPYAYPRPENSETPFRPNVTVLPSPWTPTNKLIHIAIKGYDLKSADRPRANLVFLVDISGSMQPADRLPLLKNAFRMLLDNLQPEDTVAIVTYASGSDIRLKPTKVADKLTIIQAIESLNAGGSTHGAAGITDAYKVAEASFDKNAVNRVILATDGDWNVGITDRGELQKFVERKRETGIYLSILGVGMGNHNDRLMQTLAQNGNGVAAYIDTLNEARKVLVDEASSTLFPIAKDVKIQIEFNPARVASYRLIGYETRALKREDFNNDKVDAGDIGAGHTVTAIYEITPVGAPGIVDGLRYKQEPARPVAAPPAASDRAPLTTPTKDAEYAFLKMRYKLPKEDTSKLISIPITSGLEQSTIAGASDDVRFSVAVAAFGQLLRGGTHLGSFGYDDVIALANSAKGPDPFGYRAEMINLARLAKSAPR